MLRALTILAMLAAVSPAAGQAAPTTPGATPTPTPAPAAATPEPQRTTATFGDWMLRCVRPEHAAPACEVAQLLQDKGTLVAETVFSHPLRGQPMRLTVLVPVNVSLAAPARWTGGENEAGAAIELTWRRCIPSGCVADAPLTDDQMRRMRTRTENARVMFQDAAGRAATMPFSPHGLTPALDALTKEERD